MRARIWLAAFGALAGLHGGSPPPNILFILADDHGTQAISAYGDDRHLNQTPNIDRIGREGIRFERCLVTNSLCGPARATILTGKYSHLNGFYNNAGDSGFGGPTNRFDGSQTTFPKLLHAAGYQTATIGKWHLVSDPTGFDFWQILPGQGVYYNPTMIDNGKPVRLEGYVTDLITDKAIAWLNGRDRTKPFLLMVGHKAPHRIWEPPLRYLTAENDRDFPAPPTLFDDYSGRGEAEHQSATRIASSGPTGKPRIDRGIDDADMKLVPPKDLNPEQRKRWDAYYEPRNDAFRMRGLKGNELIRWKYERLLHDYLGCVGAIDESVGAILRYLDEHDLSRNTIVIYSSDQGVFLGEHGWIDKRWIFEESLRAPLLVRWPGVVRAGSVDSEIVSNLDLAETFLDAAGLPVPSEMQGRSLMPLLEGGHPQDWRTSFYYQYYEYPVPHHVRPHYGVVTDRYKLVRFYGPETPYTELFDLERDPNELRSVYGEPEYADTQAMLGKELARLRKTLKVPDTFPKEVFGAPR